MKTPTLEEVKEYFKDAEIVECLTQKSNENISTPINKGIHFDLDSYWIEAFGIVGRYTELWNKEKGYAKIISYKEKTMKITKKFIKKNADKTFKEVFPEVFEQKLVVGKWYKTTYCGGSLFFTTDGITNENRVSGYGFELDYSWQGLQNDYWELDKGFEPATEQEVFETLKKEAVKRGFKENIRIKELGNTKDGRFYYSEEFNYLSCGSYAIFQNGIWAEIIPTITKEEAEKQLGRKII